MPSSPRYQSIPTNIITGQLGVGKTTVIKYLLANKPSDERWAVLVNEFGEVGIDGQLIANNRSVGQNVYIREVPGGCMCCSAGLPMQIALNQLIQRAKPHRLLIEPSGLGHPREILDILRGEYYRELIDLRASIALIDARSVEELAGSAAHLLDKHLQIADRVLASKADLYAGSEFAELGSLVRLAYPAVNAPVEALVNGRLEASWLDTPSRFAGYAPPAQALAPHQHSALAEDHTLPECGWLRIDNSNSDGHSSGWVIGPEHVFDFHALYSLLHSAELGRVKALFITNRGIFSFNKADEVLSCEELDEIDESRMEVIGADPSQWLSLESLMLDCRLGR